MNLVANFNLNRWTFFMVNVEINRTGIPTKSWLYSIPIANLSFKILILKKVPNFPLLHAGLLNQLICLHFGIAQIDFSQIRCLHGLSSYNHTEVIRIE